MLKIKKIVPLSLGKVMGLLYALLGLMLGVLITFMTIVGVDVSEVGASLVGVPVGISSIIVLPLLYGALGFGSGMLTAVFFNFTAKWTGGLDLMVSEDGN